MNKLNLTCINVCGIKNKLLCQEFIDLIKLYDIFVCIESKIDNFDVLNLPPGYSYISKNRKKFGRKSGGIVIIYKSMLKQFLKFPSGDSEFVLWIQLCNFTSDFPKFLLGCVYIPPENSKYTSPEAFSEIESELFSFKDNSTLCALIGDFNARSSTLSDYVIPDDNLLNILNYDIDIALTEHLYDFRKLSLFDISLDRQSNDKGRCNTYGHKLLSLCKNNNMYIANGRIGVDKYCGKVTSKESSLVDYFIVKSDLFPLIKEFEVIDFDPLFSDVHCRLHVSISCSINTDLHNKKNTVIGEKPVRWVPDKKQQFIDNFENKITLNEFCEQLEFISNADELNTFVENFNKVFTDTAHDTFGNRTIYSNCKEKTNQPWFGPSCHAKRKLFHNAKKKYNLNKTDANRLDLKVACKAYRAEMNKCFQEYEFKIENELREKSESNPAELWKILNNFNFNKSKNDSKISIEQLYDYFKNLNISDEVDDSHFDIPDLDDNLANDILNGKITEDEVISAVKDLKNCKAPGYDCIINEYIKYTLHVCMPIYLKLFNRILDLGIVPEIWTLGIIMPIYKNKGNPNDPDSYRGITLVSSVGKLFTSILNSRLTKYAELVDMIPDSQAGFRKGFSTVDNIFCLHVLIELYLAFGKKLYCTFIDFKKAFDTVWRLGLWQKLVKNNVSGKILKVIYNMYENIKSCVKQDNIISGFFSCDIGVRQGENLSPFLFSVFLADLETFFDQNHVSGLTNISTFCQEQLRTYLMIFVLLYADDTIILAESAVDLQTSLSVFESYCSLWKLTVNVDKTKTLIFRKRKGRIDDEFKLYGSNIEIVDSYSYLGIEFNFNGKFLLARKKLANQAQKGLYALYGKVRNINIPVDLQLKLFDSLIEPILLYACEVWGFENIDILERIHLQFLKRTLSVRSTTPNYMVYGETGRFPINISLKLRMLNFWSKLLENNSKLSGKLYQLLLTMHNLGECNSKWILFVKSILDNVGLSYVWNNQIVLSKMDTKLCIKQILHDQFIQKWYSDTENSSRGEFYMLFKRDFGFEKYLKVLNKNRRKQISVLRCSNVKFPIETGRWSNTPRAERYCTLCTSRQIGDEFHYLFLCQNEHVQRIRTKFIPAYYISHPSVDKLKGILSLCNKTVLNNLALFVQKIAQLL